LFKSSYTNVRIIIIIIKRLHTIEVENRFQALLTGNNVVTVESQQTDRKPGHRTLSTSRTEVFTSAQFDELIDRTFDPTVS